jgi:adenine-specific DNA-methyltransferase
VLESTSVEAFDDVNDYAEKEISELHASCGVYTRADMARRILDQIGWHENADLSRARLLEPSAGNGVFVVEAARRLLAAQSGGQGNLEAEDLHDQIVAFELVEAEAAAGRQELSNLLKSYGFGAKQATELAATWLRTGDFLLAASSIGRFTHVAGNPPYSRWSKIPEGLRCSYEEAVPKHAAKGDLFLPFLDFGIDLLEGGGKLGFLCSDRWKFMAFASDFRAKRLPIVDVVLDETVNAEAVYQRSVDIYPSVLVLRKRAVPAEHHARHKSGNTFAQLGFEIRVGPALGCSPAFVLEPDEDDAEPELLAPFLRASDLRDGTACDPGRRVLCMHDAEGRLVNPSEHPRAFRRLRRFEDRLRSRSIVVKHGAPWYRPIDTVQAERWSMPKLLVPELAKHPRAVLDTSGAVPSHGIYAIVPKSADADIEALAAKLHGDGLLQAVEGLAPMVKGGYLRCYKSILEQVVIAGE